MLACFLRVNRAGRLRSALQRVLCGCEERRLRRRREMQTLCHIKTSRGTMDCNRSLAASVERRLLSKYLILTISLSLAEQVTV